MSIITDEKIHSEKDFDNNCEIECMDVLETTYWGMGPAKLSDDKIVFNINVHHWDYGMLKLSCYDEIFFSSEKLERIRNSVMEDPNKLDVLVNKLHSSLNFGDTVDIDVGKIISKNTRPLNGNKIVFANKLYINNRKPNFEIISTKTPQKYVNDNHINENYIKSNADIPIIKFEGRYYLPSTIGVWSAYEILKLTPKLDHNKELIYYYQLEKSGNYNDDGIILNTKILLNKYHVDICQKYLSENYTAPIYALGKTHISNSIEKIKVLSISRSNVLNL